VPVAVSTPPAPKNGQSDKDPAADRLMRQAQNELAFLLVFRHGAIRDKKTHVSDA
jgi:hypothetical protein